jgi:hypothetical protein
MEEQEVEESPIICLDINGQKKYFCDEYYAANTADIIDTGKKFPFYFFYFFKHFLF